MLEFWKKLTHLREVNNTPRLKGDSRILVVESLEALPRYRHSFNCVCGLTCPFTPLFPEQIKQILDFARERITDDRLEMTIDLLEEKTIQIIRINGHGCRETNSIRDILPNAAKILKEKVIEAFCQATGKPVEVVQIAVNNTYPDKLHDHEFDVMTFPLHGGSTIGEHSPFPSGNLAIFKPGYQHMADQCKSRTHPRLTVMVR